MTGLSARAIERSFATLKEAGYLTIVYRTGTTSLYQLHLRQPDTPDTQSGVPGGRISPDSERGDPRQSVGESYQKPINDLPVPSRPDLSWDQQLYLLEQTNRHDLANECRRRRLHVCKTLKL